LDLTHYLPLRENLNLQLLALDLNLLFYLLLLLVDHKQAMHLDMGLLGFNIDLYLPTPIGSNASSL